MATTAYDNMNIIPVAGPHTDNEYAEAAQMKREQVIDQREKEAEAEAKQKKSLSTKVRGALSKMSDKAGNTEEEELGFMATMSKTAKIATGKGLRWSWMYLIPSWGLTIITLDLFAFLGLILNGAFPSVGEEWPKINPFGHKVVEKMAFFLVNAIVIMIVVALVSIFTGDIPETPFSDDNTMTETEKLLNIDTGM
jgi:hypothetical protein